MNVYDLIIVNEGRETEREERASMTDSIMLFHAN